MSQQLSRNNTQQKSKCRSLDQTVFSGLKMIALSFLMLAMLVLLARQAVASQNQQGSGEAEHRAKHAEGSYRVADAVTSLENWQANRFLAIDSQKRLDALARKSKKITIRPIARPRAVVKRRTSRRKKTGMLIKLRNSAKKKARRSKARKVAKQKARNRQASVKRPVGNVNIVREPVKLQRCLKKSGYFTGVITGRLDDATLLAFLAFRDDRNLSHRPVNLYDRVLQKKLFALCPDDSLDTLNQIVASAMGKKPMFVTSLRSEPETKAAAIKSSENKLAKTKPLKSKSVKTKPRQKKLPPMKALLMANNASALVVDEQAPLTTASIAPKSSRKKQSRLPEFVKTDKETENSFAQDVLVATDHSDDPLLSDGKNTHAKQDGAQKAGVTSSFAMKRVGVRGGKSNALVQNPRVASYGSKRSSLFPKRLSIFDLAKAQPANPNTCSPQNHASVAVADSSFVPAVERNGSTMKVARLYDDGPVTTGAISSAALGKSMRRNGSNSNRLVTVAAAKKTCLPQDLYDLLTATHGSKMEEDTQLTVCSTDCLPAPRSFSSGQKKLFAKQYDINWCDNGCLAIGAPLPLDEVMKIERDARVHVCMTPQTQLSSAVEYGLDSTGVTAAIRALFEKMPGGYGNENNIAVLIGNKTYTGDLEANAAGHVNAAAMKALLLEQLGYKQENIITVLDARQQDFVRLFGQKGNVRGELYRRLQTNPDAQLMIYYSGHASSSGLGMDNYLLPIDAIKGKDTMTAYSLNLLYDNLRELDARTTQLFLEAGFNGNRTSSVLPPNIAERRVNVAPIVPVRGLAIFSAATGDQKSLIDHETGIGLFTRFLIGGLAGNADQQPIGNGDRVIDSVELYVHLANNVRLAARKTLGLKQSPTISRSDNLFLSQLSRKARR